MVAFYIWTKQSVKFSSEKSEKLAKAGPKRDFLLYKKTSFNMNTPENERPPNFWNNIMKVLIITNILMYNTWYLKPYNTNRQISPPIF